MPSDELVKKVFTVEHVVQSTHEDKTCFQVIIVGLLVQIVQVAERECK